MPLNNGVSTARQRRHPISGNGQFCLYDSVTSNFAHIASDVGFITGGGGVKQRSSHLREAQTWLSLKSKSHGMRCCARNYTAMHRLRQLSTQRCECAGLMQHTESGVNEPSEAGLRPHSHVYTSTNPSPCSLSYHAVTRTCTRVGLCVNGT